MCVFNEIKAIQNNILLGVKFVMCSVYSILEKDAIWSHLEAG